MGETLLVLDGNSSLEDMELTEQRLRPCTFFRETVRLFSRSERSVLV